MQKALGSNTAKASYVEVCRASCASGGVLGTHHAKYAAADQLAGPNGTIVRNVSIVTSTNLTYAGGRDSWNTAQVVVGNKGVFDALKAYHTNLVKDKTIMKGRKKYKYPVVNSGPYTVWRTPLAGNNPMYTDLKSVSCKTASGYGVRVVKKGKASYRTWIGLAMFIWSKNQMKVADQLVKLKRKGCVVEVAVDGSQTNPRIVKKLRAAKIPVYNTVKGKVYGHSKALAVDGCIKGKNRHYTYGGSTNLSLSALTVNSDVIIRWQNAAAASHYKAWFNRVKTAPTSSRYK